MDESQHIENCNQSFKNGPTFTLVTIKCDNEVKYLFKLELRKNGDVIMSLKHAQFYRDSGELSSGGNSIKQQKYSLHKSEQSKENINLIKQTFRSEDLGIKNTYLATPAIKNNSGFVHIFSKRAPDLSPIRYNANIKSKYRVLNIGEYDCKSSILFYSLFIGSAQIHIPSNVVSTNMLSFSVGDFRFLVIWAFLPLPSHETGALEHNYTMKAETGEIIGNYSGVDSFGAIDASYKSFKRLVFELDRTLASYDIFYLNYVLNLFESTGFLQNGRELSPERMRLYEKMKKDGSVIKFSLGKKN